MIKHCQTIRRQFADKCYLRSAVDKGLQSDNINAGVQNI